MSIESQITRIQQDKATISAKLVEFGVTESGSNLDVLATALNGITNCGAVQTTVQEGDTYTIPKGYHNGSGTVSGVAGGGNYNLQSKTAIPTKLQQSVTPDEGYYGLSDVTISPIPQNYQDVSGVTATAQNVLAGKIIVTADGSQVAGTMPDNGAVTKTLDTTTQNYTIPQGCHSGTGTVSITTQTQEVTPTTQQQIITPPPGSVLSQVTVQSIPSNYVDTSGATATAADILMGQTAGINEELVAGTMPNNGSTSGSFDGLTTTSYNIPAGYTNGGTVTLTGDIENALAAI